MSSQQPNNAPKLPKLEELLESSWGGKKKPVNYLNYTKENYNILTLQSHDPYYSQYQKKIPVYVREQPDWTKSLYRKKGTKMTKYNYILFRNARLLQQRQGTVSSNSKTVPRSSLYNVADRSNYQAPANRSFTADKSRQRKNVNISAVSEVHKEALPLIKKTEKSEKAPSQASQMCKRSLSSYCSSKGRKKLQSESGASSLTEGMSKLTPAERLIKRAEQLGKFVQGIKTEEGKALVKNYAKQLVENLKASDIAKEQMRIAVDKPPEDLEKIIEVALGMKPQDDLPEKSAEESKKEPENEKKPEEKKTEEQKTDEEKLKE